MPRLSTFIREHREEILATWETFARKLPSTGLMDVTALRDHAEAMLDTIANDLETPQTERQRAEKAQDTRERPVGSDMTAASRHGLGRAERGFSVQSMLAEFRALRASVIHLWRERQRHISPDDVEDLTRFNEAIDQAITESVARYAREIETTRSRVLAMLGHDLRTPLGAVVTSGQFLRESTHLTEEQQRVVAGMERSGRRMTELVRDLLDLALTHLGNGMPLECTETDINTLLHDAVAEAMASNPGCRVETETSGSLAGLWDGARLAQALTNLIGNAMQHGSRDAPIRVAARGDDPDTVSVSVTNDGLPIPPDLMGGLFKAMTRGTDAPGQRHLGLGLYIVDRIVEAHGGHIDVRSSQAEGTTFCISLPRRVPAVCGHPSPALTAAESGAPGRGE